MIIARALALAILTAVLPLHAQSNCHDLMAALNLSESNAKLTARLAEFYYHSVLTSSDDEHIRRHMKNLFEEKLKELAETAGIDPTHLHKTIEDHIAKNESTLQHLPTKTDPKTYPKLWAPVATIQPGVFSYAYFTPEGNRIAFNAELNSHATGLKIFDRKGRYLDEVVNSNALFSPDGKRTLRFLIGATELKDETGNTLARLEGGHGEFNRDGSRFLIEASEKYNVYDRDGRLLYFLPKGGWLRQKTNIEQMRFLPDGEKTLSLGRHHIEIHDGSGNRIAVFKKHISNEVSSDGKRLLTVTGNYHRAMLWDLTSITKGWFGEKKPKLVTMLDHGTSITSMKLTPDGKRIVTLSAGLDVKLWDENGTFLTPIDSYTPKGVLISPDGKRILTFGSLVASLSDENGEVLVRDFPRTPLLEETQFSPDGSLILTNFGLWDRDGAFLTKSFSLPYPKGTLKPYTKAALFSRDGRQILTLIGKTPPEDRSRWNGSKYYEAKLWEMVNQ
jgi:hypothetical protein